MQSDGHHVWASVALACVVLPFFPEAVDSVDAVLAYMLTPSAYGCCAAGGGAPSLGGEVYGCVAI